VSADDELAVAATVYRYALGIDSRDWVLYRSIFADAVVIDFTSYGGGAASTMAADEWVASVRPLFTGLDATQHTMSNPMAEVVGDRATCRMYMQAHHVLDPDDPASWFTIGGYYDDLLVRSPDGPRGWLLAGVTLTVLWRRGDASIMPVAREMGLRHLGRDGG